MSTSAYVKTIQGPQGPQGPTGIQGATGIRGPTGPAGTQVITGTGLLDFGRKFIEDKEVFEDFFNLVRKSAMINSDLNSVINSLFEIFIELHPYFIFKLFIEDWSEKILKDENVGRITKNVFT